MNAIDAWRAGGSETSFDGHRVFYRVEGEGEPLLLVHGFPTASWDWRRLWSALAARFRIVAPDLLGFGFSAKPADHDYSIVEQADLCEAILAAAGAEGPVHVLAHDYGDTVVQELLARGADLSTVTLLNGGLFPEAIRRRPIQVLLESPLGGIVARLMTESRFRTSFAALFGPETQPTDEELAAWWELITRDDGRRVVHRVARYQVERRENRDRWVGALVETDVPVRLVVGPADPVSGDRVARRYEEVVPDPDVVRLDARIGHYPQVEDPDGVVAAFFDFAGARR
ncbi:MAG: alpha/beta hydrolase [Gemmatimonadota bacterium]|nr:alpha/beta hydrolase [Gemmatimonadota bacterium]